MYEMVRLGATSYVIHADLLDNVRHPFGGRIDDVGLVLFESDEISNLPSPEVVAAMAALAASVAMTGAFHLDGVADLADGLFGARDRRRALENMKDSRVGAFGVIALAMVLLAKWVALTRLIGMGEGVWIIAAATLSWAAMVELAVA